MRKFKLYDTWISIGLIIASVIGSLVRLDGTFLICYFIVGGWQLISMIVHAMNGWFIQKGSKRLHYHYVVAVILTMFCIGFVIEPVMWVVAIVMFFAAAPMAIFYTTLCYNEIYVKMRRPLALLK